MKATCILCALAFVLLVDLFSQTCADDSAEEASRPSSSWLRGNKLFHDLFQRQTRWGGRHIRPQGRVPRAYEPDAVPDDEFNVFRRWGSRRFPFRGAGHKRDLEEQAPNSQQANDGEFKREDGNDQAVLEDVYQYLRN